MTTRIKICGFTRTKDVTAACRLGVHAIGFNFVGGPRKLEYKQAFPLLRAVTTLVEPVGLFMHDALHYGHDDKALEELEFSIEVKQWYGKYESLEAWYWGPAGAPWWIVVPVANRRSLAGLRKKVSALKFRPHGIVLDTAAAGKLGGTGKQFNWNWIAEARAAGELKGVPPIILAGGLNPENVAEAIRIARPYAVDVSSGVEVAGKPGVKDVVKMRDFVQAVRGADAVL